MIAQIEAPRLMWEAMNWLWVAAILAVALLALLFVAYWKAGASPAVRAGAACLKVIAILILAACLLEPVFYGTRARPGSNQFVVLADNSQSMTLKDADQRQTRAEELKSVAGKSAPWLAQIGRDFDLHQFSFDSQLHSTDDFAALPFDGHSSDLGASLDRLIRRYQGRPLAGIMLLTDGSATDSAAVEKVLAQYASGPGRDSLPPIYPVLIGGHTPAGDISLDNITVTQTSFEDAPVTLTAEIMTSGYAGKNITAELMNESGTGTPLDKQTAHVDEDGQPVIVRFRIKPEVHGLSFYRVRVAAEGQLGQFADPKSSREATLANNVRIAAVDRGRGPFKILYVTGRLYWEYKFLERSLSTDDQLQLTALIRVAKREPKFNFIARDSFNPLFQGFDNTSPDQTEQYDQPIIMRVSADKIEPHAVFPKTAEELDSYHAIILDRVEAEFFTPDQLQLIKDFVRQRGGGLMMLGGEEDFKNGKYDRTPIGDVLPVYCDDVPALPDTRFQMALTREGWLEPWLRLRPDEESDSQRLAKMPPFFVLNAIRGIKPGATVLARATAENGVNVPALVEQRFGRGRSVALLIGSLWQWELRRANDTDTDFEKAWRQIIRWLVSDVPERVDLAASPSGNSDDPTGSMRLTVQVRDPAFQPLDNASVTIDVTDPAQHTVHIPAEPSPHQSGQYEALYVPHEPGPYRASATVAGPDAAVLGRPQTGWTSDPAAEEFRVLAPNRALLERIAHATGGEMVDANHLARFAASLPTRHAQITEPYVQPFWQQSWIFLLAIACLAGEWGLRRWRGLP